MNPPANVVPHAVKPVWRDVAPVVFADTILVAAANLGVQPLAVEKDYWVCEALRAVERAAPNQVMFKGGTSLEKLRIIQRFSEDLDLLVVSTYDNERAAKRSMKGMCQAAAQATCADLAEEKGGGNLGAQWRHAYLSPQLQHGADEASSIADPGRILLEFGQSGGTLPSSRRQVESLLTRELIDGNFDVSEFGDLEPFETSILHPGRTLVEKLLRMNNFALMSAAQRSSHGWPRIGRQFYDLWALLANGEVRTFLSDRPLAIEVLQDCYRVSEAFVPDREQPTGGFALSPVFAPDGLLTPTLEREHERAMQDLYYGANPPTFRDVIDRVAENRDLLNISCQ